MRDSMSEPFRIMLVTDVFPPGSGGSGWSTYYLGKALAAQGHEVNVLRPRYDLPTARPAVRRAKYGELPVEEIAIPNAPAWARRAGLERAWRERQAVRHLGRRAMRRSMNGEIDVLHGQHKVSAMAVSTAARRARSRGARVVAVATVRDYWPLCPVSTRLFAPEGGETFECQQCHRIGPYLSYVRREGKLSGLSGASALARWAGTRQAAHMLAECDATVAVSRYVRDELARSGRVPGRRLYNIPNLVDLPSVDQALAGPWPLDDISPATDFALFVGKWDVNKGAQLLSEAVERAGLEMPVVMLGDGPLKAKIGEDARERGLDFRFYSWLDNDAVLRVLRSARALLFPSAWQEPLSRVLLEGCAAGAAIVALDTGGTGDVISHGVSGWLAADMDSFTEGIKRVTGDDTLNASLRAGARARAESTFAAPKVAAEMETLYCSLLQRAEEGAS
jgi:glycogen(starch) synthase